MKRPKQEIRDIGSWIRAEQWAQDARYALRMMRKSPGFTSVAVLTLMLGIGANTAIFSIVDSVLLRPLPYAHADRIVVLGEKKPCCVDAPTSTGMFDQYRRRLTSVSSLAAISWRSFTFAGKDGAVVLNGQEVTPNFFQTLGVTAEQGRVLNPALDISGGLRSAVLSHGVWQRVLGGAEVVGSTVMLSREPYRVVGIMPATFVPPAPVELWVSPQYDLPAYSTPARPEQMRDFGTNFLRPIGRLIDGVSRAAAQAELDVLSRSLEKEHPDANAKKTAHFTPLLEWRLGSVRLELWTLFAAVVAILMIACANLANLLLARSAARGREFAVRSSLGAGKGRVARQLLTESVSLALLGGAAGYLLAVWLVRLFPRWMADLIPRSEEIRVNPEVFAFAFGIAIVTGIFSGLAPALRGSHEDLQQTLRRAGRGAATEGGSRTRQALVIAQAGLSLVLLVGAGLLIRSYQHITQQSPGFRAQSVITAQILLPSNKYDKPQAIVGFFEHARERLRQLPAVAEAGYVDAIPFGGGGTDGDISFPDRPKPRPGEEVDAEKRVVSEGYFQAMGIPVVQGRAFTASDDGKTAVVIINERLARFAWPGQNPIGKKLAWDDSMPALTVVGVVGNVKQYNLGGRTTFDTYLPYAAYPLPVATMAVRTNGDPMAVAGMLRQIVRQLDPEQPVSKVRVLQDMVSGSYERRKVQMLVVASLALLAGLLVGVGIFGVVSYSVEQRVPEIGVRMALGAKRSGILGLVLRSVLGMTAFGVALGLVVSLVSGQLIESLLYGVRNTDPLTYAGAVLLLLVIAVAAGAIPALRAARVDPMTALRSE